MFHLWNKDINSPDITIRRLRNFFDRLPFDSETLNDIGKIPREARAWNFNTYMLANIFDAVMALDWHTVAAHSKNKPQPPKPFPRPKLRTAPVAKKKMVWPGKTIVDRSKING